jgi:hypothetical protein
VTPRPVTPTPRFVSLDLCVRLGAVPEAWLQALEAVRAWQPDLFPACVDELTGPAEEPRPWSPGDWERLAALLGGDAEAAWEVSGAGAGSPTVYASRGRVQCRLTVSIPRLDAPLNALSELVLRVAAVLPVGLGMAFDPNGPDAELVFSGLQGLGWLAPVTYLDAVSVERLGGIDHVLGAPCPTARLATGVILDVRPLEAADPEQRPMRVSDYLGISPEAPVRLLSA